MPACRTTTAEKPTNGNTFLVWRQGTLDDFELTLRYMIEGGNSGIQYRSHDHGDFVVGGYQADIDSPFKYTGMLYEEKGRGIFAKRGEKVVIRDGDDVTLIAAGPIVTQAIAVADALAAQGVSVRVMTCPVIKPLNAAAVAAAAAGSLVDTITLGFVSPVAGRSSSLSSPLITRCWSSES